MVYVLSKDGQPLMSTDRHGNEMSMNYATEDCGYYRIFEVEI